MNRFIQELSQAMMDASICGLGQAAPNPALSVLKCFPRKWAIRSGGPNSRAPI